MAGELLLEDGDELLLEDGDALLLEDQLQEGSTIRGASVELPVIRSAEEF